MKKRRKNRELNLRTTMKKLKNQKTLVFEWMKKTRKEN